MTKRKSKKNNLQNNNSRLQIFSYIALFITLIVMFFVFDYAYRYTIKPLNVSDLPLIKKSTVPEMIIPEDKGGITVQNKDKLILQNKQSKQNVKSTSKVESVKSPNPSIFDAMSDSAKSSEMQGPFKVLKN